MTVFLKSAPAPFNSGRAFFRLGEFRLGFDKTKHPEVGTFRFVATKREGRRPKLMGMLWTEEEESSI